MGRAPCCDKANVNKGPWSPEEDGKLKDYIQTHGTGGNWITLPQKAGLRRCGKSCRLRWLNYLRPNIKHGGFSDDEDKVICTLFASIGSRWSIMAAQLPGRTDNDIKNYWNTKLKKKMMMNTLNSMPPISSTKYSYPSLPVFNNNNINININGPLSSSPLVSQPSSYMYSSNSTSSYYDQALSIPSSPTTTAAAAAASDHHHLHHYDQVVQSQGEKGCYGDVSFDFSTLEEIKQLISTSNIDNSLNFFVDDTKEVEKVMYY